MTISQRLPLSQNIERSPQDDFPDPFVRAKMIQNIFLSIATALASFAKSLKIDHQLHLSCTFSSLGYQKSVLEALAKIAETAFLLTLLESKWQN